MYYFIFGAKKKKKKFFSFKDRMTRPRVNSTNKLLIEDDDLVFENSIGQGQFGIFFCFFWCILS